MNIADVKVGHVGLEERVRGMKGETQSKRMQEREGEGPSGG